MADPYGYDRPTLVDLTDNVNTFRRKVNQISDDLGDKRRLLTDAGTSLASDSDIVGNLIELDYRINETSGDLYLRANGGSLYIQNGNTSTIAAEFLYDSAAGNLSLITPMSGDFTIDTVGDIIFDADGNDIRFKNGGGGDEVIHTLANTGVYTITAPDNYIIDVQGTGDITLDAAGQNIYFDDAGNRRITYTLGATTDTYLAGNYTLNVDGSIADSAGTTYSLVAGTNITQTSTTGSTTHISGTRTTHTVGTDYALTAGGNYTVDVDGSITDSANSISRVSTTTTTDTVGTDYALTAGGNYTVDVDGSMKDSAGTSYTLVAGTNISQTATTGSITHVSGTTTTQTVGTNYTLTAGGNSTVNITGSIDEDAGTTIDRTAGTNITDTATGGSYSLTTGTTITQTAGTDYALTAGGNYTVDVDGSIADSADSISRVSTTTTTDTVGTNYIFTAGGNYTVDVDGSITDSADSLVRVSTTTTTDTVGSDYILTAGGNYTTNVDGSMFDSAGTTYTLVAGTNISQTSTTGSTTHVSGTSTTHTVGTDYALTAGGNYTTDVDGSMADSANSLSRTATTTITDIASGAISQTAGSTFTQTSGGAFDVNTTGDITLNASGNINLDADGNQVNILNGAGGDTVTLNLNDDATFEIDAPSTFTIDAVGDIFLDAGDSDIYFQRAGTTFMRYRMGVSGTETTHIDVPQGNLLLDVTGDIYLDADGGNWFFQDNAVTQFEFIAGTNKEIDVPSGDLTIDVAGDINLDAAGQQINFLDATNTRMVFNLDTTPQLDVTGNYTVTGTGSIVQSSTTTQELTGTDITLDASNNIYLEADGDQIHLRAITADKFIFGVGTSPTLGITGNYTETGSGFLYTKAGTYLKDSAATTSTLTANSVITRTSVNSSITDVAKTNISQTATTGSYSQSSGTTFTQTSGGAFTQTLGGNLTTNVTGNIDIDASGNYTLDVVGSIRDSAATYTTISGGATSRTSGTTTTDTVGTEYTLTAGNKVSITGDSVDIVSGSAFTLTSVGDFTTDVTGEYLVDASGDITLDADGNDIIFKNGAGADTVTHTLTEDGDYTITQSGSGDYTVDVGGDIILDADDGDIFFKDAGTEAYKFTSDGTISRTGDILVDVTGDITLDAAGDNIVFADAGSTRITYTLGATTDIGLAGSLTTTVGGSTTENVTNSIERNAGSTILDSAGSSHTIVAKTNLVQTATDGSYTLTTGTTIAETSGTTITRTGGLGISDVVSSGNYTLDAQAAIKDSAGTTHTIVAGTAINQTAKTGFIQTVTGGNFTTNVTGEYLVDASGDITLDADGNDIIFKNGAGGDVVTHTLADNADYTITAPDDFVIDAEGDITLDANGNDIFLRDGASVRVQYNLGNNNAENWTGNLTRNVSGSILDSAGTTLTHVAKTNLVQTASTGSYALTTGTTIAQTSGTTFTQTSGGNFTTNVTGEYLVDASGDITLDADGNDIIFKNGAGADTVTHTLSDAGAYTITQSGTGDYKIDVGGDIILDANGGDIRLFDDTVEFGRFSNSSSSLQIFAPVQDKDINFVGNDGGITITALSLDMSDSGSAIFSHDIYLPDNGRAVFGAGSELEIYHDGSNSYIRDNGTGELRINTDNAVRIRKHDNETLALFSVDGSATLYHDNSPKIATTATGIDVTGSVVSDGLTVDGVSQLNDALTINRVGDGTHVSSLLQSASDYGLRVNPESSSSSTSLSIHKRLGGSAIGLQNSNNVGTTAYAIDLNPFGGDVRIGDSATGFIWDASTSRLGLGTTTPDNTFHVVAGADGEVAQFTGAIENRGLSIYVETATDASALTRFRANSGGSAGQLAFNTDGNERLRIDASGNVGIGTDSPAAKIDTAYTDTATYSATSPSADLILSRKNTGNTANETVGIRFDVTGWSGTTTGGAAIEAIQPSNASTADLAFLTRDAGTWGERLRLTSNGNLLVGKTSTSSAIAGTTLWAGGYINSTVSSDYVARFNRLDSDGEILQFQKDNVTVGSIGTVSSGDLYIADGRDAGLKLDGGNNKVLPVTSAGAQLDNTLDLGTSSARFKDLHLSGTAYLPSVDIDGGSIVGCTEVGSAASPISSGEFNTLTVNTNLSVPGSISPNGIIFNDASALGGGRYDQSMTFGNDSDLAIYHDGSNSYISDKGTGDLRLTTNVFRVRNAANTQTQILAVEGGAVTLFHNDASKLVTTSTGVTVTGLLTADTKSFTIDHPTKEGMKLRYGSLEGPEHGVYVRGRLNGENTIELPEVWLGLVDEDTITVNLTPIGKGECWVEDIDDNTVKIGGHLNCFYMVLAERKDVEKLKVEFPADGS